MSGSVIRISKIIPLREKIGNYDLLAWPFKALGIIPLREKIGNYDSLYQIIRLH